MGIYKKYFNRLPFWDAIRFSIANYFDAIFGTRAGLSFSHFGEEKVIRYYLSKIKNGFYIDVGCNHPYYSSNTFHFYLRGWKGIVIDPNDKLIKLFKQKRKEDIAVVAAISDTETEVVYHEFNIDEVNSILPKEVAFRATRYNKKSSRTIKTRRLDAILKEYLPENQAIDLLSIDVEGLDFNVLRSLNFDKYRPKFIVVEIHLWDLRNIQYNNINMFLTKQGYELVAFSIWNGFFIDKAWNNSTLKSHPNN